MRIAAKFTLAFIAGILLVHATSAWIRVRREIDLFQRDVAHDARVLGRALSHAVERVWGTRGELEAREIIAQATEREAGFDIRWVWLDSKAGPEAPAGPESILQPLERGESVVWRLGAGDGALYTYVPVNVPGGRRGAIELSDPFVDERSYVRQSVVNAITSAGALVLLSAVLAWFLGLRLIGWPVRGLVEQARRIGRGHLSPQAGPHGTDELGELAREMDAMCGRLREARDGLEVETRARLDAVSQLRHAGRLATVGTLASGLAHELGTPLNVVSGHAQLIREEGEGALRAHADVIARQCGRMEQIVRQLLDFARSQAAPAQTFVELDHAVQEALGVLEPLARRHDVDLSLSVESGLRARIGREQLQQLLVNLVINAVQATPEGGPVEVKLSRTVASHPSDAASPREYALLSVRDYGQGIAADTIERIFEPFFTTKRVGEGTGLGLAVAYGIVQEQRGWIDVTSEPGKGSCFTVHLPVEPAS